MPLMLDLFCGAGGAAAGYARAGWEVIGIDIVPQPHYPWQFIQMDALAALAMISQGLSVYGGGFMLNPSKISAIHASPLCQIYTRYRNVHSVRESTEKHYGHSKNYIPQTRAYLNIIGIPSIIENVQGAPLEDHVQLCGTSFGIPVRRHRWFELNWPEKPAVPPCDHGRFTERRFPGSSNRPNGRTVCNVGEWRVPLPVQKECMQVDWDVELKELSQMVPPAMTEYLGRELLRQL